MTSLNSKTSLSSQAPWAERARNVEPSEQLVKSTLVAMHDARAECDARGARGASAAGYARRARGAGRVAGSQGAAVLTRRRFVALGGVCVAAAAVAVGIPLAWRGSEQNGAAPSSAPSFGLAVAQAAEPGKSVTLHTSDATLMPLTGSSSFRCLELALNLQCVGDNIDTLTFSLLNVPTVTIKGTRPFEPAEREERLVTFSKDLAGDFGPGGRDDWSASLQESDGFGDGKTLLVDMTENPNWNGSRQTSYGTECDVLYAATSDEDFWGQDSVLAAKEAWLDSQGVEGASDDEIEPLLQAYMDAYAQVSATQEDAVAWARTCYVNSCSMAAENLAQSTLQVEAGFADGSTLTKRYRIGTVDDFADVMGARYDALYDLRSAEPDLSYRIAPCYSFTEEYHAPSEDARLSAPLFTITDITDEKDADEDEKASESKGADDAKAAKCA